MPYDRDLAQRIRQVITADFPQLNSGIVEKVMFGGLAFLVGGNMAVAASSAGGLMVRSDPSDAERHIREGATPTVMRGREMRGWLTVTAGQLIDEARLAQWVSVGISYAQELPPK